MPKNEGAMPDFKTVDALPGDTSGRSRLLTWALRLSLLALAWLPLAALGSKFGLWGWKTGLMTMTLQIGPLLIGAALLLALIAVGFGFFRRPRVTSWRGWLALLIPLALLTYGNSMRISTQGIPPIHDISTDTTNPPTFSSKMLALRGSNANPLVYEGKRIPEGPMKTDWSGRLVVDAQRSAYPDIQTISVNSLPPERAFRAAVAAAESMGLDIVSADPVAGMIEGTDTTFWYGFKDDVAIRVTPSPEGGSLINIRSISRVGMSDVGKNADRIRAFRIALEKQVKA
jgi:Protein of unknown function (DUF1499)